MIAVVGQAPLWPKTTSDRNLPAFPVAMESAFTLSRRSYEDYLTVLDAYQAASNAVADAIDHNNQLVLAGLEAPGYIGIVESEAFAAYKVARRDFEDMMDDLEGTRL